MGENIIYNKGGGNDTAISNSDEDAIDYAKFTLRLFICVAGICGNCMVIFVIVVLKEYKKAVTHWYVLQLAIADSVFLLTLPFKMVEDLRHEWIYSSGMCKAKETILFLNYYASILILMIMSIDRYVAVCHGFSDYLRKFRTHKAAYIITAVVWLASLTFCTPVMLYSNKIGTAPECICQYAFPNDLTTLEGTDLCTIPNVTAEWGDIYAGYDNNYTSDDYFYNYTGYDNIDLSAFLSGDYVTSGCHYWDEGKAFMGFLIFNFVIMFLLPLIVMVTCYTLIVLKLQETTIKRKKSIASVTATLPNSKSRKRSMSTITTRASSDRDRVTIMCAVLVILFVVCWLPFHSVHMAKIKGMYVTQEKWCELLPLIASMIMYMNSALNPYLYNFLGTRFGRRFRNAMTSVRVTVKNGSSVSSASGVRYSRRKQNGSMSECSTSHGVTFTTKLVKRNENNVSGPLLSASTSLNEQHPKLNE